MSSISKTLPSANQSSKTQDGSSPSGGTGGSGLTSVGIAVPSFLNAGGSPLTANGTIIIGFSGSALPIQNGGTGITTLGLPGQVLTVGLGGLEYTNAGSGTVTQVAATVPDFLNITGSPINDSGILGIGLSGSALPTTSGGTGLIDLGSNGQVLTVSGGVLTYTTPTTGTVTQVSATVPDFLNITGSPINTTGTLGIGLSGSALPTTSGGTGLTSLGTEGQVLTTTGGVLAYTTPTVGTVTSVGITTPSFLTAGSAVTSSGNIVLSLNTQPLPYTSGGTGLTLLGTPGQLLSVNSMATGLEFITSVNNINSITGVSPILVSAAPNVQISTVTTGTGSTLALSSDPVFTDHVDITGTDLSGLLRVYQNTFTDTDAVLATFFNASEFGLGQFDTKIQVGINSLKCATINFFNGFSPKTIINSFPGTSEISLDSIGVVTVKNVLKVTNNSTGSNLLAQFITPLVTTDVQTTDIKIGRTLDESGVLRYYRNLGESTFQMFNTDGTAFIAVQGNRVVLSGDTEITRIKAPLVVAALTSVGITASFYNDIDNISEIQVGKDSLNRGLLNYQYFGPGNDFFGITSAPGNNGISMVQTGNVLVGNTTFDNALPNYPVYTNNLGNLSTTKIIPTMVSFTPALDMFDDQTNNDLTNYVQRIGYYRESAVGVHGFMALQGNSFTENATRLRVTTIPFTFSRQILGVQMIGLVNTVKSFLQIGVLVPNIDPVNLIKVVDQQTQLNYDVYLNRTFIQIPAEAPFNFRIEFNFFCLYDI